MNNRRIMSGSQAAAAGQDFESSLSRSHEAFARHGLALIHKLPVPTVPVRGDIAKQLYANHKIREQCMGRVRMIEARQGYDFYGVFGANAGPRQDPGAWHGLSIAMESKQSKSPATSLPIVGESTGRKKKRGGTGIKIHQLKALAEAYRDFGTCAAIVWSNAQQRYALVNDGIRMAYERYVEGGRKSIPVDEFKAYEVVDYPDYPRVEDWLYVLRCWLETHGRPCPARSKLKVYEMIDYRLNAAQKRVTITKADGSDAVIENVPPDRVMLDLIAREASTAEEFVGRLQRLGSANE